MLETVEDLASALAALAVEEGVELDIARGIADGFGETRVPILDVSLPSGPRTRAWESGRGDFIFQVGAEDEFAGWWRRRPKKQAVLPRVILELAHGRFEIVDYRVTVRIDGKVLTLRDQM